MAALRLFLSLAFLLSDGKVLAMKPAPFDEEYSAGSPSGAKLVSSNSEGGGYSTEGVTEVFGADGSLLYQMPLFTGRRKVELSSDGSVIVMDGNVYFGTSVMTPPSEGHDPVATSVYLGGKLWRDIRYGADLNGGPIDERKIRGGGWTKRPFSMEVDWERDALIYGMREPAKDVEIPLPPSGRGPEAEGGDDLAPLYDTRFSM